MPFVVLQSGRLFTAAMAFFVVCNGVLHASADATAVPSGPVVVPPFEQTEVHVLLEQSEAPWLAQNALASHQSTHTTGVSSDCGQLHVGTKDTLEEQSQKLVGVGFVASQVAYCVFVTSVSWMHPVLRQMYSGSVASASLAASFSVITSAASSRPASAN